MAADARAATGAKATGAKEIAGLIVGRPISIGTAIGRARVVTCGDGSHGSHVVHVVPGDILVVPALHAALMPLLRAAGGVIAETASVLSDPAIVARELGVPVVAGIERATDLIPDGEWVTVDGTAGTVALGA